MHVRLELMYRTKSGLQTKLHSDEEIPAKTALKIAEDLEATKRVRELTFIDQQDRTWTLKQLKKFFEEIKSEPHNITVYFDGGFDRSSRRAGLGIAIYYEQADKKIRIRKNRLHDQLVSNNEAEYAALYFGMTELENLGVQHLPVTFIGDSKVVVNQLNDEWPCYEAELAKWMDRIEDKINELGIAATFKEVSRKQNREADQLASQALAGVDISSNLELE